jgi:hypothetical protein
MKARPLSSAYRLAIVPSLLMRGVGVAGHQRHRALASRSHGADIPRLRRCDAADGLRCKILLDSSFIILAGIS